jgi:AbrB family looped-hinge helix DNA binding protein
MGLALPWKNRACGLGIENGLTHDNMALMNARLIMDKAGRVVIPKSLRDELHLEAGDALDMEVTGERITLRPFRGSGPLGMEQGVWVLRTGQPMLASTTDEMLLRIREGRDLGHLGKVE